MNLPSGFALFLSKKAFEIIREINNEGKTILLVEQSVREPLKWLIMPYVLEVGSITLRAKAATC